MHSRKALIVDKDPDVRDAVSTHFTEHQFDVTEVCAGSFAMEMLTQDQPDIILMETILPGADGFSVIRDIREKFDIPIILLVRNGQEFDGILGLELGADDYVTKPFSPRELLARAKAIFRRIHSKPTVPATEPKFFYQFDNLVIDTALREVTVNGTKIELRPKEFDLLVHLAKWPGHVYTREQLLNLVWGKDMFCEVRTVDVYIKKLRQKLCDLDSDLIHTVWGVGYKFQVKQKIPSGS